MYTDAHIHLHDIAQRTSLAPVLVEPSLVCTSAFTKEQHAYHASCKNKYPRQVFLSFGIHPQNPDPATLPFLESLAKNKQIVAIGECGFDFYTKEYRSERAAQETVWNLQLDMAQLYGLPLIIHARKALPEFFRVTKRLAKLQGVIFHGWPGSSIEASSFLSRGVNAFFSVGKGLLRGQKSLIETVKNIPEDRILAETDAPWMTVLGEDTSQPADIINVYEEIAKIREISVDQLKKIVLRNFKNAFAIPLESL